MAFAALLGLIGSSGCGDDPSMGWIQGGEAFCSKLGVAPSCSDDKTVSRCSSSVTSAAEQAPECAAVLDHTLACISLLSLECTSSQTSVARGDEAGSEEACIRASDGTDYCVQILDGPCAQLAGKWKDCLAGAGNSNGAHEDTKDSQDVTSGGGSTKDAGAGDAASEVAGGGHDSGADASKPDGGGHDVGKYDGGAPDADGYDGGAHDADGYDGGDHDADGYDATDGDTRAGDTSSELCPIDYPAYCPPKDGLPYTCWGAADTNCDSVTQCGDDITSCFGPYDHVDCELSFCLDGCDIPPLPYVSNACNEAIEQTCCLSASNCLEDSACWQCFTSECSPDELDDPDLYWTFLSCIKNFAPVCEWSEP